MKCYCCESDSAVNFCVDEVESAQLEEAILNKAWKKIGDEFIMSFPKSAFSNQHEKELITSNFVRHGPAMFESSSQGVSWEAPLEMLAQKFNEIGIEWYIVGSAGDALRGIDVHPSDIDIVVLAGDYPRAREICYHDFHSSVIAPFMGNQDPRYFVSPLKYFGRLFLAGCLIEIAADEIWDCRSRETGRKHAVWRGYEHSDYEKIEWRGHNLYVESLEHRYQIEIARNRRDRVEAFEAYMGRNRCGEDK